MKTLGDKKSLNGSNGNTAPTDPSKATESFRGSWNIPLSSEGVDLANQVATNLQSRGGFDEIHSSDLDRAHNTAKVIGGEQTPVNIDPRWRPMHLGALEGQPVTKDNIDILNSHIKDMPDKPFDGISQHSGKSGESYNQFKQRTLDALYERLADLKANPNKRIAITTHHRNLRNIIGWLEEGEDNPRVNVNTMTSKGNDKPGNVTRLYFDDKGKLRMENVDVGTGTSNAKDNVTS